MNDIQSTTSFRQTDGDYIKSYLILRQLIGLLGIGLPFALIIGNRCMGNPFWLQESISIYYYSYMHLAFVGVLSVLGIVLITYHEAHFPLANKVSTLAGFFAIGVAAFPTVFDNNFNGNNYVITTVWKDWFQYIHFGSAFLLFGCFAVFCFVIFQRSDDKIAPKDFDDKKRYRNKIYKICGWGIVISIALIGLGLGFKHIYPYNAYSTYSTFIFETTALLFFGNSWLLKGTVNWEQSGNTILEKMVSPVR